MYNMGCDDVKILNALGNETRLKMFKHLNQKDMHISKIARELNISIPVASKHATVLEDANLICRKVFGKTHVLSVTNKKIFQTERESDATVSSDYQKILTTIYTLKKVIENDE